MLQLFRSGLTSYFATALLGLLIASFAMWGIGSDILRGTGNNVALIGDEHVSKNNYAREFQNKFTEIQQRSETEVTREMVIDQGLAARWATDLVQREAFAYAAHDLNIRVTDNQLRDFIKGIEAFQDTLGKFSKSKFDNMARYRGNSSSEFEEILRRDLERQNLIASIVSGINVPDTLEKTLTKYLMEERTAEIITIPANSIKDIKTPDEETLKAYYQENSKNYMAPEYRDFRFITLSASDFEKDVVISPEELAEVMASPAGLSSEGATRDFEQILFDSKESADKAYSELQSGKKFSDIIVASGSTVNDATILKNTIQNATDSFGLPAAKAIFTTEQGKYTVPMETSFGWRIFNVTKVSEDKVDKDKLQAEAIKKLKNEKALTILYDKSELINDELAAGGSLSDIASNMGLELKKALNVDASGYNAKGDLVKGLPTDPTLLAKAFESLVDDEPSLEEMKNGDYYLLVVDNIQESVVLPYEQVKTSVFDLWKAEAQKKMSRKKADEILAKAEAGTPLQEIATASPDTAFNAVTLVRTDQTQTVSPSIHKSIFSLELGKAEVIPAADGNGYVVVKTISRKFPDSSLPLAQKTQLKTLLVQEYQQRILTNYWKYLETSLPVKINGRAIADVNNRLSSREQ